MQPGDESEEGCSVSADSQTDAAGGHVALITESAYEAIRSLNHVTRNLDLYVPDVYRALANLQALTAALPQALGQLTTALERALQRRKLLVVDGDYLEDPFGAVTAAAGALDQAQVACAEIEQRLESAQQALTWVSEV